MQRHAAQFILVLLALGLLLLLESRQEFGSSIDERFAGWLATNTARPGPAAPLVLVEINDSSLGEKHSWPWSPLDYALFFQALLPNKPAVVAVEPVLDWDASRFPAEEQPKLPQYENILHNHLLSAPKTVLGALLGIPEDPAVVPPMLPVPLIRNIQGDTSGIPEFTDVAGQPRESLRLAGTLGFTNLPAPGTAVRKIPLLFRYRGEVVPSFVLQTIMLWMKLGPEQVSVVAGSGIALGNETVIPIDRTGAMWIGFGTPFTRFGEDELLLAMSLKSAKQTVDLPLERIRDGIALLARTDRESRVFNLPDGRAGSAGELMASAIATIQSRAFIKRAPFALDAVILLLLATLGWALPRKTKRAAVVLCAVLLVVYLLASLMVFQEARVWLPMFMPVSLLVFALVYRLCGHVEAAQEPR